MDRATTLRRALVAAVAAVACALATASPAAAGPADEFPPDGPAMRTAYDIALRYWGATPCGGAVRLVWTPMRPENNAIAQWLAIDPGDPETYSDCTVHFNAATDFDWPKLCSVAVHEVGHLLGHEHTHDTSSVMSEAYAGPIAACAATATAASTSTGPSSTTLTRRRAACMRRARGKTSRKLRRRALRRCARRAFATAPASRAA